MQRGKGNRKGLTLGLYETNATNIPSGLLAPLADALGVTIDEILGIGTKNSPKRGPKSKPERQFEFVRRLPRKEQEFVSKFLDNVISNSNLQ